MLKILQSLISYVGWLVFSFFTFLQDPKYFQFSPLAGARWLCSIVLGSWPKGCEFDPGSQQFLGRDSALVNPSRTVWSVDA